MLQLWVFANTMLSELITKLGAFSLGLNVIVLVLAGTAWLCRNGKIATVSAKVILIFLVYCIYSFAVALTGPCTDHLQKSILTMPVLAILILLGLEIGRKATDKDWLNLQTTASWALLIAFLAFIPEALMPNLFPDQARYRLEGKLSGIFSEPSHVAFSLFPCIVVLLVSQQKKTRRKGILALLGLLVLSRSSTLIAFILVWVIYHLLVQKKSRETALYVLGIALLVGFGIAIDYDRFILPTVERFVGLVGASDTNNLSSFVYMQGWQDAWYNLRRTHGLGLGFNMMGCAPIPDVSARSIISLIYGDNLSILNAEDGSFLFAKVVSEDGAGGIVLYAVLIWWWLRLEKRLRSSRKDTAHFVVSIQSALIFFFVACSFIRSGNYFNGGVLILVATVSGASKWQQRLTIEHEDCLPDNASATPQEPAE
jgi:hypothetical protein